MAAPYLTDLEALINARLGDRAPMVTCKHFFSGAAAYVDDRIFATLSPVGLAFKLSDSSRETHLKSGARPLRYFANSPVKRGYVLFVNPAGLDPDRVASMLAESMAHALASGDP